MHRTNAVYLCEWPSTQSPVLNAALSTQDSSVPSNPHSRTQSTWCQRVRNCAITTWLLCRQTAVLEHIRFYSALLQVHSVRFLAFRLSILMIRLGIWTLGNPELHFETPPPSYPRLRSQGRRQQWTVFARLLRHSSFHSPAQWSRLLNSREQHSWGADA